VKSFARNTAERKQRLLLHSCCAPCCCGAIERLREEYEVTVYYYNPNIFPVGEYVKRLTWQRRLPELIGLGGEVGLIEGEYDHEAFTVAARGLESEAEGGLRCRKCFELRLDSAAAVAAAGGFDLFTTTLSVSPHKDAAAINELGAAAADKHSTLFLYSNFKKRDGYRRSVELSGRLGIYRQRYCGCEFSMRE
jgi:predicted adenine nucleotide alpha hydrolase (AANH) superfamily ATPase